MVFKQHCLSIDNAGLHFGLLPAVTSRVTSSNVADAQFDLFHSESSIFLEGYIKEIYRASCTCTNINCYYLLDLLV